MNIVRLIFALVCLAVGLVIGILNTDSVHLNLIFAKVDTMSGVAIIVSLLAGVCIGALIVLATVAWPLYARLRKAGRLAVATTAGARNDAVPPAPGV